MVMVFHLPQGLSLPRGIAVDSSGLVYVCDQDDRCVYVLDYSHNGSLKKVSVYNRINTFTMRVYDLETARLRKGL